MGRIAHPTGRNPPRSLFIHTKKVLGCLKYEREPWGVRGLELPQFDNANHCFHWQIHREGKKEPEAVSPPATLCLKSAVSWLEGGGSLRSLCDFNIPLLCCCTLARSFSCFSALTLIQLQLISLHVSPSANAIGFVTIRKSASIHATYLRTGGLVSCSAGDTSTRHELRSQC